jgi:PAS domain S-box-containing protein
MLLWREVDRPTALRAYDILDTAPEAAFDDIAKLAAHVCQAPIALVSLVEDTRQWFKAEVGLGVRETPIEQSICAHAIRQNNVFVMSDATQDPRFAANPLVTGEPHIRFYAGAPLEAPDGLPLGTLCVIDRQARPEGLTPEQCDMLLALARQVVTQLEHRRALVSLAEQQAELAESEARFRAVANLVPDLLWSNDPTGATTWCNQRWLDYTGETLEQAQGYGWLDAIHPDDRETSLRNFQAAMDEGRPLEQEHRIRAADGRYRWFLVRAEPLRDEQGLILQWFGAATDIHDLRRAQEHQRVLLAELQHRVRNILAVVRSIAHRTADTSDTVEDYAMHLDGRINALARTQTLVARSGQRCGSGAHGGRGASRLRGA